DVVKRENGATAFSASTNGMLVYRSGVALADAEVNWFDRSGHRSRMATLPPAAYLDLELDSDGRRLAMHRLDTSRGIRRLVIHDTVLGNTTPLTFGPADAYSPRWSPDGNALAYASVSPLESRLYRLSARGGDPQQLLDLGNSPRLRVEDWSSDGQTLIYT